MTLTGGFCLQTTEVTQSSWSRVMGTSPSWFSSCGGDCPVERVSWYDALAYANALSQMEGLEECYVVSGDTVRLRSASGSPLDCTGYRLPTESEWEYAARAGTRGARYGALDEVAWYDDNANGRTHRVGTKQANAWGLYDMLGNVFEWVWDGFGSYPSGGVTDPLGAQGSPARRVIRGGGGDSMAYQVRAAYRKEDVADERYSSVGFRRSRSLP